MWDIKQNKQLKLKILTEDFRAIDWPSDSKFIIIGTINGNIYHCDIEKYRLSIQFKYLFYSDKNAN